MSPNNLIPATPRRVGNALNKGNGPFRKALTFVGNTLFTGPRMLCTSRLNHRTARTMMLLCTPALLFATVIILPPLLFNSENNQAYFYSARFLVKDPATMILTAFAGLCAILSLALPAADPSIISE